MQVRHPFGPRRCRLSTVLLPCAELGHIVGHLGVPGSVGNEKSRGEE